MFYAGIGSRQTPGPILKEMERIAERLGRSGYTLRSGGAIGADMAFETGARRVDGQCEILRPKHATPEAMQIASEIHPAWHACDDYARKLHGRNSQIILGLALDEPVQFVLAYQDTHIQRGGTWLGIKLAMQREIPVWNLFLTNGPELIAGMRNAGILGLDTN